MEVDWLNINPMTGGTGSTSITVGVTDNTKLGINRYATVRFTNNEGLYADLDITQTAYTEGLTFSVSPYILEFETSGETLTGTVFSNSRWFVTDYPDWVSIVSSTEDNIGAADIYITAAPNTGNTERAGNVVFESFGEERMIYLIQPAYSTLKVQPKEIRLAGLTGATATTSVTVTSSANWSVSDYNSDYLDLSVLSGESGTTTVSITLQNVPEYKVLAGIQFQQTITFTDNITEEVVTISLVGDDNIDDQYITVTYYSESAGQFLGYKYPKGSNNPEWSRYFQDAHLIESFRENVVEEVGNSCIEFVYVYFYTDSPGYHSVKYYSKYYTVPFGAFLNNRNVYSVVIGDRNIGSIQNYAFTGSSLRKLVFGLGRHSQYGWNYSCQKIYGGEYFYIPTTTYFQYEETTFRYSSAGTLIVENGRPLDYERNNGIKCRVLVLGEEYGSGKQFDPLFLPNVSTKTVIATSTEAPSLNYNTVAGVYTVYYPSYGTGYDSWFDKPFLNMVPYDDINDVPF